MMVAEETPIKMLEKDHRKVEELFNDFKNETDTTEKNDIVKKICKEISIHSQVEEELFYPQIENFSEEGKKMIEESRREHESIKMIVAELADINVAELANENRVFELEKVKTFHVKREEDEVFPFAQSNISDKLGLSLSAKMLALKEKLRFTL